MRGAELPPRGSGDARGRARFLGVAFVALAATAASLLLPPEPASVASPGLEGGAPAVERSDRRRAAAEPLARVEREVARAEPLLSEPPDAGDAGSTDAAGEGSEPPSGRLVGRVVDEDGRALPGWEVRAASDQAFDFAKPGPEGVFVFDDLPAGRFVLDATHPLAPSIESSTVEVVAGATHETTLVYTGPSIERRLLVRSVVRPLDAPGPGPRHVRLFGARGEPRTGSVDPERGATLVFDDLPPGPWTITIDDPRYAPWRKEGVRPGRQVLAELTGKGSLELRVFDQETNVRLENYELRIGNGREATVVKRAGAAPPPGHRFLGLTAGPLTIRVASDGYRSREIDLPPLGHGERRVEDVPMQRRASIRGLVVDAAGAPVPHAPVILFSDDRPFERRHFEADGNGRFDIAELTATRVTLQALRPGVAFATPTVRVELAGARRVEGLVLHFPPAGVLRGFVHAPGEIGVAGLVLVAMEPPPRDWRGEPYLGNAWATTVLEADGRFELGPLPYGELQLHLELAPAPFTASSGGPIKERPYLSRPLGAVRLEGAVHNLEVRLDAPIAGGIDVTVRRGGAPAEGVVVWADHRQTTGPAGAAGKTDALGRVRLEPVFDGQWTVTASDDDGPWVAETVLVEAGRVSSVLLDL